MNELLNLTTKLSYLRTHPGFRERPARTVARLISWRLQCLVGSGSTVDLTPGGPKLFLPPEWRGTSKTIYAFRDQYERELDYFTKAIRPGAVVVDVGANYGIYTVLAAGQVGALGKVIAIEPAAAACRILRRNVRINHLTNVQAFQCALSDRPGAARLYHHPDPSRNSFGKERQSSVRFEEVPVRTLDDLLAEQGVQHVDFVKVDAEGAEELIFSGAQSLLARSRPSILFEVNRKAAELIGVSATGAWDLLSRLDYKFFSITPDTTLKPLNTLPEGGNVLAMWGQADR